MSTTSRLGRLLYGNRAADSYRPDHGLNRSRSLDVGLDYQADSRAQSRVINSWALIR
ncbi:hypothetical protein [Klebsiella phage KP32_isolate 194]|uniref:Uncharacterized protein n=1 Tax=Klebsiella phage KP32_isolate 194 TaxID=2790305 RepID=A0A2U8USK4_9CAUD|nr:hypothetical protein HOT23_gp24 [Klebsiella phage KP32_isolate 194]AWN07112.1 hypothetical protein [Klebsiella phage KP32_isolate 194]